MGKFLVKHPDHVHRAQRIALFCKEVKRALLNLCLDHNVRIHDIDVFVSVYAQEMEYTDNNFDTTVLLRMLLDDLFIQSTFAAYRDSIS